MKAYDLQTERTAVILIDFQERLFPAVKGADKLLKPCRILLKACEVFDLPLIITEQYPKGLGPTIPQIMEQAEAMQPFLVEKTEFSAARPDVLARLQEKEIETVLIAGIETHVCVFQTVRDLLQLGYRVQVAEDGVSSRTGRNRRNGLRMMAEMGAVISNAETMVFDLLKKAGTPEFKQISQVVK